MQPHDPSQNSGDVEVIDEHVRYELRRVQQFAEHVGRDDVSRPGLVRRQHVEREFPPRQRPLSVSLCPPACTSDVQLVRSNQLDWELIRPFASDNAN